MMEIIGLPIEKILEASPFAIAGLVVILIMFFLLSAVKGILAITRGLIEQLDKQGARLQAIANAQAETTRALCALNQESLKARGDIGTVRAGLSAIADKVSTIETGITNMEDKYSDKVDQIKLALMELKTLAENLTKITEAHENKAGQRHQESLAAGEANRAAIEQLGESLAPIARQMIDIFNHWQAQNGASATEKDADIPHGEISSEVLENND